MSGSDPLAQSMVEIIADTSKVRPQMVAELEAATAVAGEAASKVLQEELDTGAEAAVVSAGEVLTEGLTAAGEESATGFATAFDSRLIEVGPEAAAALAEAFRAAMTPAIKPPAEEAAVGFYTRFTETVSTGMREAGAKIGIDLEESTAGVRELGASLGESFVGAFKLGSLAIAGGTAEMTKFGLEGAANIQKAQIAFDHMTGSVQVGNDLVERLNLQAAKTPFQFQDLQPVAQRFLAIGDAAGITSGNVLNFTTALEDATVYAGGNAETMNRVAYALDEVASKGKLTQASVTQLSRDLPGLNVYQILAAGSGLTLAQVHEQIHAGTLSADQGIQDYIKGLEKLPGVSGSAAAASNTLGGSFATLKDNIRFSLSEGFAPVVPQITKTMNDIVPVLNQGFSALGPVIGQALSGLLPLLSQTFSSLVPVIAPVVQLLSGIAPALTQSLQLLAPVFAQVFQSLVPLTPVLGQLIVEFTQLAIQVIKPFLPLLGDLLPILQGVSTVLRVLSPVIVPMIQAWVVWAAVTKTLSIAMGVLNLVLDANPFVLLGVAVVGLVAGFVELYQHSETVRRILADVGNTLLSIGRAIITPFIALWKDLVAGFHEAADFVQKLPGYFNTALGSIGRFFDSVWQDIVKGATVVADFFAALPGRIVDAIVALPGLVWKIFTDAVNLIVQTVHDAIELVIFIFIGLPFRILDALANLGKTIFKFFYDNWDNIVQATSNAIAATVDFFVKLPGRVINALISLGKDIGDFIGKAWDVSVQVTLHAVDSMIDFFVKLPGRAVNALATLGRDLANVFTSAWNTAYKTVTNFTGQIIQEFKDLPGQLINAAVGLYDAGAKIMGKLWDGLKDALGKAGGVATDIGKAIVNGVISVLNSWVIDPIDDALHDIHIPGTDIGFGKRTIPEIPKLALGAVINRPTLALIGEGDTPEVVIPLGNPARAAQLAQQSGLTDLLARQGTTGPRQVINMTVNTVAQDPAVVAAQVVGQLARKAA